MLVLGRVSRFVSTGFSTNEVSPGFLCSKSAGQCTLSLVHPMFGDVDYGELEESGFIGGFQGPQNPGNGNGLKP